MLQEIRVRFQSVSATGDEPHYKVQLTDTAGTTRGVTCDFTPFLTDADYENLRWYLEEYMDLPDGGAIVRAEGIERQLEDWGRRLFDALFTPPENLALLKELLNSPAPRELTIATDHAAVLRLPWELIADNAGNLAQRVSVRRQLDEPEPATVLAVPLPLRLLYIVSRPADAGFIDPRLTSQTLFAALDPLGANVQIDFCRPPTIAQMQEMLRAAQHAGKPYHVVHFDGHGTFLPEFQIGALCFEKADEHGVESKTDLVKADRLGELLANYQVPLVVLEACRSGTVGKSAVFRSVAPRLIRAGVDSVLSMGHAVHVVAAKTLLDRFYRELARGTTIGHAVAEARSAMIATNARWVETGPQGKSVCLRDWFLPHLYQRGSDDPLLPHDAAANQAVRQYDVFLSNNHNPKDSPRVEALAKCLIEKHGLRVWLDKWECVPGDLKQQCLEGIRKSRFTVVAASQRALDSKWVAWEIEQHRALNPEGDRLLPIKLESVSLPEELDALLWVDCTDPTQDTAQAAYLAGLIRTADAEDSRRRRGYRPPPKHGEPSCFPRPPQYGFQGRARELYELERHFRHQRGIVLHAMGGMGKTTLATEAAHWWTRSGLFHDGACFISFEQFVSADRVVQLLGNYCEGPKFDQLPAAEQRRRAIEYFHDRELLLVWDNYESVLPQFNDGKATHGSPYDDDERRALAELFRDLTSESGRGRLLVTCRPGETGLPGAMRFELQGLARPDSLWLLHYILLRQGLTLADPRLTKERLEPLLRDLADHPLSLELVGPHLRTLSPETIRADFGKLLGTFQQSADQSRNSSLLASLEFSRQHLSDAAREALPWLGLFSGGVFEDNLLDVSQMEPAKWAPIRAELAGIALLRVEDDVQIADRPFLRFHPTLAIASADTKLAEHPETRQRFVEVYGVLMRELDQALNGSQSRTALAILDREEVNYRTAVHWAVADQQVSVAAALGETFRNYLERSGRLRDRDAWVEMLLRAVGQAGFTAEAAAYERQQAWTRFTQGDPQGAVDQLQALVGRLRQTTEFDPAFQLASAFLMLGRVLNECGASEQAILILRDAIERWETLVQRAGGHPWEELLDTPDFARAATELVNLAAAMGDLANACRRTGHHDEALAVAERGLTIGERLGNRRNVAAGHGRCAAILTELARFDAADARYERALDVARQVGDQELIGTLLQHQGSLALNRNQLDRASRLYQQALDSFGAADDQGGKMQTYNSLGILEQELGRLAVARAWYEKSRELAEQLRDQPSIAAAAQNLGIVCQLEGEAARERGDESAARRHFQAALLSITESLRVKQSQGNKPNEASSWFQLGRVYLLLGDLDAAEQHAHAAREIYEPLGLKEASYVYNILSEIAAARGDTIAAAEWAKKRDDLLAELKRRAGGNRLPAELFQALQQITILCARAGFDNKPLSADATEFLDQLAAAPAPNSDFAAYLRQLATGQLPAIPASLPAELQQFLTQLTAQLRTAS